MNIVIKDSGKEGDGRFTATKNLYHNSGSFFYNIEIIGWGPSEAEARLQLTKGERDLACFLE